MVINKVSAIYYILQIVKKDLSSDKKQLLEEAEKQINAIVDWIRFLELTSDLKSSIQAMLEYPNDRRKEPRFPVAEAFKQFVALEIELRGFWEGVELLNISNSGILFCCNHEFQPGTSMLARLVFLKNPLKSRSLHITVKHCHKKENLFITGAEVQKDDAHQIKLLEDIYEYMRNYLCQEG